MVDEEPSMLSNGSKREKETAKVTNFDPDEDGFEFGIEKASVLHKNINILQFIRKTLMPGNFKMFETGVE